ncbi:MAG: protein kinase [Archangiaceae bacterium]|nr:protein kinase [Archangiaceae bacterium]
MKSRFDGSGTVDEDDEGFPTERRMVETPPAHEAVGKRPTSPALTPADSTIPFRPGAATIELESMRETLVPPKAPQTQPGLPANPPPSSAPRRLRGMPQTERAPAIRFDAPTPHLLEQPGGIPQETQPGHGPAGAKRDALIGTKLGEYVVEERVGIGGMGIVYRAVQPLIGNSVAIKVLRPDVIADENDLQRFLGEARTVNSIRHRSIISIFGAADTPDGRKYLVMEYLEGESLEARLQREGRLPTADALPILEDVLSALAAAHSANVVHRDLKPANVFLVHQSDGRPWVKLLDFGLARGAKSQEVSRIAGTPDYISPEHARGKPAGPASDLYGFGVLAFHLLTGKLPFTGNTPMEVMEKHVHSAPPVPHEVDETIPMAMSQLILRLLDKEPQNRPDAKTVKADLKAAAKELRQAQTQVGPRPQAPGGMAATLLNEPALQVPPAAAPRDPPPAREPRPDPRLERRAIEADRAREGHWLGRNWPWLAGGLALTWLLTVALYLLLQRPPAPDTTSKPILPPRELKAPSPAPQDAPPDTTGAGADQPPPDPTTEPAPAKNEAKPEAETPKPPDKKPGRKPGRK